jgi:MEDS: MEthanogen/methylotroph, DcmR Sensory domain
MEEMGRNPGRLISAWQCALKARDPDRGMRGLGEPVWAGRSAAELDECERHERLVNLAFGQEPALTRRGSGSATRTASPAETPPSRKGTVPARNSSLSA